MSLHRTVKPTHDISSLCKHFQLAGRFVDAKPYGSGHINDTYLATYNHGGSPLRYVHQRINHTIFKQPSAVMENICRVTDHIRAKIANRHDAHRRVLTIIPSRDGEAYYRDAQGNYWRTYGYIENTSTYDIVRSVEQAAEAAKAFGEFQSQLADLPPPRLHDTILHFHDTPMRFAALEGAIQADTRNRAHLAQREIDFALKRKPMTGLLLDLNRNGEIPERITHNDTKFNNIMFDNTTGEALCVIDLDTTMPGLALYDFGDMVRTATSPAAEDEKDLQKVMMQFSMFAALVRGYLSSAGAFLNKAERQHLVFASKLITFEIGTRFLADHLDGDVYFRVHREGHNLDRCRTQFKLVESIEQQEAAMNKLVETI